MINIKTKILIIEKDLATINSISTLIAALNFERIIFYNWNPKLKSYPRAEIVAIFINVEIPMINVDKIINEFQGTNQEDQIPIFYLYNKTYSDDFITAMKLPHTTELRKPFTLVQLYQLMDKYLNINQIPEEQLSTKNKAQEFRQFSTDFKAWLAKYNSIFHLNSENS